MTISNRIAFRTHRKLLLYTPEIGDKAGNGTVERISLALEAEMTSKMGLRLSLEVDFVATDILAKLKPGPSLNGKQTKNDTLAMT